MLCVQRHVYYGILLYSRTAAVAVVDAHNDVPGIYIVPGLQVLYTHDDIRVHKGSMFCHTCFASHNTWLTGPAVGLARSARTITCIVKGKAARTIA